MVDNGLVERGRLGTIETEARHQLKPPSTKAIARVAVVERVVFRAPATRSGPSPAESGEAGMGTDTVAVRDCSSVALRA
jgi:hypothetical protein